MGCFNPYVLHTIFYIGSTVTFCIGIWFRVTSVLEVKSPRSSRDEELRMETREELKEWTNVHLVFTEGVGGLGVLGG